MALALASDHGALLADDLTGALHARGMTVSYGQTPVVFSVDMDVPEGAMMAIIGPNGAGKSTLLKAMLGIVRPLSGSVRVFGTPMKQALPRVAYVPQRASVDWDFPTRAMDVVMMGLARELGLLRRVTSAHRARAMECLDRVGMADFATRQIGQLSGGQQQRVFLARALAQDADLYLLDEPFAGVDAATEAAIVDVLQQLRDAGKTVVAVHHDLSTVETYFDHVFLINRTRIAQGPVGEVFTPELLDQTYGGRLATAQMHAMRPGLSDSGSSGHPVGAVQSPDL